MVIRHTSGYFCTDTLGAEPYVNPMLGGRQVSRAYRVLGWSAVATWLPFEALETAFAARGHWKYTRMP